MKGESHADDLCWITKSHHPFRIMRGEIPKASNKTFTIVRNPLDVLPSFASLVNTTTHGVKPDFSYDKDYPEWWDWYVRKFAKKNAHFFAGTVK